MYQKISGYTPYFRIHIRFQRFQVKYKISEILGCTPYIRDFMIHIRYQRFQVTYKISEILGYIHIIGFKL